MKNYEKIYSSLLELTQKVCGGAYSRIGSMYEKSIGRMIEKSSDNAAPERIVKILTPAEAKKPEVIREVRAAAPVKAAAPKAPAFDIRAKAAPVWQKVSDFVFGSGDSIPAKRRVVIAAVAVVLVATTAITGAIAFLADTTSIVTNTFKPAEVESNTEEDFDDKATKENVRFQNTGDIDVFFRANLIISIKDASGNIVAKQPVEGVDYTFALKSGTDWQKGSDGFYYFTKAVAQNEYTDILVEKIESLIPTTDGLYLDVQVLSQAIQADPADAVLAAWGLTASNGVLTVN